MIYQTIATRKPSDCARVFEYMGGAGDVILRLNTSPWYASLEDLGPGEEVSIVLMSHNPGVADLWRWHPKQAQIHVFDFGFSTPFHPWESPEWRAAHGMPEVSACPPPADQRPLRFYPSLQDCIFLNGLLHSEFPYAIVAPIAGVSDRTIAEPIQIQILEKLLLHGIRPVLVGLSRYGRPAWIPGCIDLVDRLSIPGTIEAIRGAALVVACHSSVLHMSWFEKRPVFLLYPHWVREVYEKHGAVGYFFGANYPTTSHMDFSTYTPSLFEEFLKKTRKERA